MSLTNPDARRALRSAIEALVALALVVLVYWITSLLSGVPAGLEAIARGCLIILGLNAVFYGAENTARAIKLTGPLGTGVDLGPAQDVATAAQDKADQLNGAEQ